MLTKSDHENGSMDLKALQDKLAEADKQQKKRHEERNKEGSSGSHKSRRHRTESGARSEKGTGTHEDKHGDAASGTRKKKTHNRLADSDASTSGKPDRPANPATEKPKSNIGDGVAVAAAAVKLGAELGGADLGGIDLGDCNIM